jgi:Gpi18-like mannosyltransferase
MNVAHASNQITQSIDTHEEMLSTQKPLFWRKWYTAFVEVFPVYLSVHLAFVLLSFLAGLFTTRDFAWSAPPFYTLWQSWLRWDTGLYITISQHGYVHLYHTAFFPLYPFFERVITFFIHSALIAGLLISDIAGLVLLIVLYQLVHEDFDQERAARTILYLSIFPTAFYLASGYNESLFICLALLCFYNLRHGNWWLAALFGFLAGLTRSAGLLLVLPFCYEYLRQHQFMLKKFRLDFLGILLIPLAVVLFGLYCYYKFHDFLAFSHVQATVWNRHLHPPWYGFIRSIRAIRISSGPLSFQALRNLTDLVPDLLILLMIAFMFVGPWRLRRDLWVYGVYALSLYLFFMLFPMDGTGLFPLQSTGRFMLEVFPAFIVLATLGKYRLVHLNYLFLSGATLFFLLTQFLTNHWVP